jgi:hypothetical protein
LTFVFVNLNLNLYLRKQSKHIPGPDFVASWRLDFSFASVQRFADMSRRDVASPLAPDCFGPFFNSFRFDKRHSRRTIGSISSWAAALNLKIV